MEREIDKTHTELEERLGYKVPTMQELHSMLRKWEYIVEHEIDRVRLDAFFADDNPNEAPLDNAPQPIKDSSQFYANCVYCQYYYKLDCENCPLFVANDDGININCTQYLHPWNDWWSGNTDKAETILKMIKDDIKRRTELGATYSPNHSL